MYKFILIFAGLLFACSMAVASTSPGFMPGDPIITDQGGPDAFGYRWIDNDSAGGPAYNWVDITGFGTPVNGLHDDNNIGPISMGIQFPYYWYSVNRMWIGSNGYISFSSSANFAHPFQNIPNAGNPNDLLAVLTGDLNFDTGNPSCYYYSNAVDSFIVSWINVSEYSNDGSCDDSVHTFQVILCATDSSVTFQYGLNRGNFSAGANSDVIGMENVNGQVGIQYLRTNAPANHMWHDGLALRFYVIPNPSFVVHDFGMVDGLQAGSGALFVPGGSTTPIRSIVKNYGNQVETNVRTSCIIRRRTTAGAIVYHDTLTIASLNPGEQVTLDFPDLFAPDSLLTYSAAFATIMSPDQNINNNTMICEIDCYHIPQYLKYDDNVGETVRSWTGDFSGFGLEFEVPEPVHVDSVAFNIGSVTASGAVYIWIHPDDGTGRPDESVILAADTVDVTVAGWITVDFTWANLNFGANSKFYLVEIHALQNTVSFGMDQTAPLSRRGWEHTGGLAPDRERDLSDVMMRAYATAAIPGTIQGSVNDGTLAAPIPDVIVTTYNSADVVVDVDTSDAGGLYTLDVEAGIYRETFEKAGFQDLEITNIVVQWDSMTTLNVIMQVQSGCIYVKGDINGNGVANGIDVTYGVAYFKGGNIPPIRCDMCPQPAPFYAAGDVNGNCAFNGIDVTFFVAYLKGGPALRFCETCPPAQ